MVHSHSDRETIPHRALGAYSLTWENVRDKTLSEEHAEVRTV